MSIVILRKGDNISVIVRKQKFIPVYAYLNISVSILDIRSAMLACTDGALTTVATDLR